MDELHEQLFIWERELDNKEGTIIAWEDGLSTSKRALGRACMDCDIERTHTEVVRGACLRCYPLGLNSGRPLFPWPQGILPVVFFF
jgi:hypothetical protein